MWADSPWIQLIFPNQAALCFWRHGVLKQLPGNLPHFSASWYTRTQSKMVWWQITEGELCMWNSQVWIRIKGPPEDNEPITELLMQPHQHKHDVRLSSIISELEKHSVWIKTFYNNKNNESLVPSQLLLYTMPAVSYALNFKPETFP